MNNNEQLYSLKRIQNSAILTMFRIFGSLKSWPKSMLPNAPPIPGKLGIPPGPADPALKPACYIKAKKFFRNEYTVKPLYCNICKCK